MKPLAAACWLVLSLLGLPAAEITFVAPGFNDFPTGATGWRYRLGTSEASTPSSAWRTNGFVEDGTWNSGAIPIGYTTGANDPLGYEAKIATALPTSTVGNYTAVYLRKTFVVTNRLSISSLKLGLVVDDGAVVWVNGREVTRFQCCTGGFDPNVPSNDSAATTANESTANTNSVVNDITGPLVDGTNVLAIMLFNANLGSSDLVLDSTLIGIIDDIAPTVTSQAPQAGATIRNLNTIQVNFSEDVMGADAADLLINGQPATNLLAATPAIYTFEFAQPLTGLVSVAFAAMNGITDTASNAFAGASWSYTLDPNLPVASVYISEFLAQNNGSGTNALRDENGDASDWIEIRNSSSVPANLGGWYLTDNFSDLTQWQFPPGATVPGFGYMVVFASGKNRTNNLNKLHTSFSLNNGGEFLGLVDPSTNIVSQFHPVYPAQTQNISYGRDKANPDILGYFPVPTPGADNLPGTDPGLEVQFSRTGGTFAGSFNLVLSTANTNNVIRYTLVTTAQTTGNATNYPTPTSTLYTGPITVNNTLQVRARAFPPTPTSFPGSIRTECYIQVAAGITNYVSSLPIIVLHTINTAAISGGFPSLDNSIIVACFDNDPITGQASLMGKPQMIKRAGINLRGSSTQGFPKSSFALELWDEFNEDDEASLAGLPQESDWVLYAPNQFDLSMMHNSFMHRIGRDMGYYSSRTRFVEVFFRNGTGAITANTNSTGSGMGDYNGVYVLEEKVKRDGNRLDIDLLQPEQTNAPAITGGYLLKIDRTDGNERTFTGGGLTINYQDPDGLEMVTAPRLPQANYIKSIFDLFNTGLTGNALTNVASTNHYSNYLDIDTTLDLHIVNVLVMNADAYRLSGYITKPRNGKFYFGPLWDVDRGMGTKRGDERTFSPRAWQSYDPSGCGGSDYGTDFFQGATPPSWFGRLFADVDFWQRWIDRYQDWRTSVLDSNRVVSIIDGYASELREAQVREQKRWTGSGASDTSPRSGSFANCANNYTHVFPGTYQGEVDFQKRWLIDHLHFMDTNLLRRPSFTSPGGQVPSGTAIGLGDNSGKPGTAIYYTLDGSDPRGFQGRTNPAAILYTGPITVTNNLRIHARAVNASHRNLTGTSGTGSRNPVVSSIWSGNIVDTYYVALPRLVVTELMYNPAPSAGADTNDVDNYEYVELRNTGTNTLSLAGFKFTQGIEFTFPSGPISSLAPGNYVLVVKHLAAFTNRYGARTNIAGIYSGNLDNGGERVTLIGPVGEPILDFTYNDGWHLITDGAGFSLQIIDDTAPLSSWNLQASWRPSGALNGTPGLADPGLPSLPVVYVNEVLSNTDPLSGDAIELFNPNGSPVDVGGWLLTDSFNSPRKYRIPDGTLIPANGYIVFYQSNSFGVGANNFALSSRGDEVYLFSGDANTNLTGYVHGFDFGPQASGATYGRHVISTGADHFPTQTTPTLGGPNSGPLVGPFSISEINYHPIDIPGFYGPVDNQQDEYVELRNISGSPARLFDPAFPTNAWRLRDAVDYTFPTNITVPAGGFVVVVGFDPADTAAASAFRARNSVPGGVPLYGPWSGQLDNSSDSVELVRPDVPAMPPAGDAGTVYFILADRVKYEDKVPWPEAADGIGPSLHRINAAGYGNDPANWTAAPRAPGAGYVPGTPPTITQHPANTSALVGNQATFSVMAAGSGLSYQWRRNGSSLSGATNSILILSFLQTSQAGQYDCVVLNASGATISAQATLTVIVGATISQHPVDTDIRIRPDPRPDVVPNTNAVFQVIASSQNPPLTYQWRFNLTNIAGATGPSYTVTNVTMAHLGQFSCAVSDGVGSIYSSNAWLYPLVRPLIWLGPVNQTVPAGSAIPVSVVLSNGWPPPFGYQWRSNSLTIATPVSSSKTNFFVIPSTFVATNAVTVPTYRVIVTNRAEAIFQVPQSIAFTITTVLDSDRDGIADSVETALGLNPNSAADALLDLDGDGMSNLAEVQAGTDATNVSSFLRIDLGTMGDMANITVAAISNRTYSVQYSDMLPASWSTLASLIARPTNRVEMLKDPNWTTNRFYRLTLPAQ